MTAPTPDLERAARERERPVIVRDPVLGQLVLDNPDVGTGLRELTDAVHAEGAAIAAQIGHAGPVANPMGTKSPAKCARRWVSRSSP